MTTSLMCTKRPRGSNSDAVSGRRRGLAKVLLVFLVLMAGPILCSVFYLTW